MYEDYNMRSHVWWPSIDTSIERCVKSCTVCQTVRNSQSVAPLYPWLWIHVDFAGPINGKIFLLVVDAHSKWPEIIEMPSTTTQRAIEEMRRLFAAYGLPEQVVSDNGPQFSANEFATFVKFNGIKLSSVLLIICRTDMKKAMNATEESKISMSQKLANFLLTYRTTP